MGQIFHACAYDIKAKTCCVVDADKFHANCYSFSGAVASMHYLLRHKTYRIMWGGAYVVIDDHLAKYSRDEDLYGISTYQDYEDFEMNNDNLTEKEYYDKVKLIAKYRKQWKKICVWDKANEYFDWDNTNSVKYEGYMVNHTKKQAVDLEEYYRQSKSLNKGGTVFAIDLLPVLTETGEGTAMALYEGISTDSTEELAGKWCGDELQIVDELPQNFKLINCCIAEIWNRARFCYSNFGVNQDGHLLKDDKQNLYEATRLNFFGKRGEPSILKVEKTEKGVKYSAKPLPESQPKDENENGKLNTN